MWEDITDRVKGYGIDEEVSYNKEGDEDREAVCYEGFTEDDHGAFLFYKGEHSVGIKEDDIGEGEDDEGVIFQGRDDIK